VTRSEIKAMLAQHGIMLTKSLGQNFLHDQNQVQRIAEAAQLKSGDRVLEIGPGLGPLTRALLGKGARVTAVEIDRRLHASLEQTFQAESSLTLIHADALKWLRQGPQDWSQWKLVSNLPYSVGSPIVIELALLPKGPSDMVVTLQQEVIDRMMATPDSKTYGVMSLLIQLRYRIGQRFRIPAGCFFPEPDVESSCLALHRRHTPLLTEDQCRTFVQLVKLGFSQRRKVMWKLLKQRWHADLLETARQQLELDPMIRAQALGLDTFVALTQRLHPTSGEG
jgi:16S rRNA (adenine1518-N6/adenine1519-N6)-dimethyltransferase